MDGDVDTELAVELARFLLDRYPRGLAFGALASADVRHAVGEHMKAAGIKCFKPKWLHRFPNLLIYDGKFIRAISTAATIEASPSLGEPENEVYEDRDNISHIRVALDHSANNAILRSCLKSNDGVDVITTKKHTQIRWARFLDYLSFKPGNAAAVLMQTGRDAKRPIVFDPPERGLMPFGYFQRGEGRVTKNGSDMWCDSAKLPPVGDDEEELEEEKNGAGGSVEKVVHEFVELPNELASDEEQEEVDTC